MTVPLTAVIISIILTAALTSILWSIRCSVIKHRAIRMFQQLQQEVDELIDGKKAIKKIVKKK